MPFLYFVASGGFGKFGHCNSLKRRFAAYNTTNPCYDYAALMYDLEISKTQPLDNYINANVLLKRNKDPLVQFKIINGKRSDWFHLDSNTAYNIILYIRNSNSLSVENYNTFARNILGILIACPPNFESAQYTSKLHPEVKQFVSSYLENGSGTSVDYLYKVFIKWFKWYHISAPPSLLELERGLLAANYKVRDCVACRACIRWGPYAEVPIDSDYTFFIEKFTRRSKCSTYIGNIKGAFKEWFKRTYPWARLHHEHTLLLEAELLRAGYEGDPRNAVSRISLCYDGERHAVLRSMAHVK